MTNTDEATCGPCAYEGREPMDCYRDGRRSEAHRQARVLAHQMSGLGA